MIKTKRAYDAAEPDDGARYLVDRLWPRGVKGETLAISDWLKEAAPSDELRKWFGHDPQRWDEFRQRYFAELDQNPSAWAPLLETAQRSDLTLVYAAKDKTYNNAVALKEYIETQLKHQK